MILYPLKLLVVHDMKGIIHSLWCVTARSLRLTADHSVDHLDLEAFVGLFFGLHEVLEAPPGFTPVFGDTNHILHLFPGSVIDDTGHGRSEQSGTSDVPSGGGGIPAGKW